MALTLLALALGSFVLRADPPGTWDHVNFPTAMIFIRLTDSRCGVNAERRFECLVHLDALARAASEGREFIALHAQLSDAIEAVTDPTRVLADDNVTVARYTPGGIKELKLRARRNAREMMTLRDAQVDGFRNLSRQSAAPIEFERTVSGIMARTTLHPREVAVRTLILLARDADPYLQLYAPPPPPTERKLTLKFRADGGHLLLSSVPPESNLDRAGLGLGDRVVTLDGRELTPLTAPDILGSLPPGDTVRLGVNPLTGGHLEVEVERREFLQQPVHGYVISANGRRVGVIEIQNFGDDRICELTAHHLRRLHESRVDGLIYDFRSNPGGRIEQARCVLGLQLGRGKMLWRQNLLPDAPAFPQAKPLFPGTQFLFTDRDRVGSSVPTVILINAMTASAAELAAASLRERGIAWLVGSRSFGKGVSQSLLPLVPGFPDVLAWKTIARSEHRDGFSVQGRGLNPDFVVKSKWGGTYDAEDDQRPRFADAFGAAFTTTQGSYRRPAARAAAFGRVRRCVETIRLRVDQKIHRWLRDRQLRGAVAVALCTPGD